MSSVDGEDGGGNRNMGRGESFNVRWTLADGTERWAGR